jgi:hypothetical protein
MRLWPSLQPWMSLATSSGLSPAPAWLLVTDTRVKPFGPEAPEPASLTATMARTAKSLWLFAGLSALGLALRVTSAASCPGRCS